MAEPSRVEEFLPGIAKLEGASNYLIWAFRVKLLLKLDQAWFVVEREIPSDEGETESRRRIQETKDRAMHILKFTLSESATAFIRNLRDPSAVWTKLKTCFEARSRVLLRQSSDVFAMLPVLSSPDSSERQHSVPLSNVSAAPTEETELQKKKNLAMVILVESVQDRIVPLIMDLDDPANVWARLKYLFDPPALEALTEHKSSAAAAA